MSPGEKIKELRKQRKISGEVLAKEIGISKTTISRYENGSIKKIPYETVIKLCEYFNVSQSEFMENDDAPEKNTDLPAEFQDAREAMEFIVKLPMLAAYGEYDPKQMSDETIVEFANEILQQFKLVSYKFKNQEK